MDGSLTPLREANSRLADDLSHALHSQRAQAEGLADAERRHDNLLHEYQKLDKGFDEVKADLQAAQQRYDELASAHVALTSAAQAWPSGPASRLERRLLQLLRSRFVRKLSQLASFTSPGKS
jgi:hypothetical protein